MNSRPRREGWLSLLGVAAVWSIATVGCGGGGESRPPLVTPSDVAGLPSGDATGQARSGTYTVSDATADAGSDLGQTSCSCRVGDCASLHTYDGWWIVNLVEDSGTLTMSRTRGGGYPFPCTGGINVAGDFWCGVQNEFGLFRMDGQVTTTVDGAVTGLSMTSKELVQTSSDTVTFDCDVQQKADFSFAK